MKGVVLPVDLADEFHPNVRIVPMSRHVYDCIHDWADWVLKTAHCPACDHSPHPTAERLDQLRTMPYSEYLLTPEWQETRLAKLDQAGHECRKCGAHKTLHVHHLTYDHVGHEWLEELVVLCRDCHEVVHGERDEQRQGRRRRR